MQSVIKNAVESAFEQQNGPAKKNHALNQEALKNFDTLPDAASVRLPVVCALFACSKATAWRSVKAGRIPQPKKLSPRTTCWNVGELKAALASLT